MRERHVIHQRRVDLSCQSLRSSTAHLTAALTSFCVLCLLSLSPWMKTAIHHSLRFFFFFFHLCVLCSPLIYCWTCLQNGPGAFHSVKRGKGKRAPVSEKSTSRNRENSSSVCTWTLAQWEPARASELSWWCFVWDAWSGAVTARLTWFTFDYLKQNRKSTQGE